MALGNAGLPVQRLDDLLDELCMALAELEEQSLRLIQRLKDEPVLNRDEVLQDLAMLDAQLFSASQCCAETIRYA
jgi:hypothetical protein